MKKVTDKSTYYEYMLLLFLNSKLEISPEKQHLALKAYRTNLKLYQNVSAMTEKFKADVTLLNGYSLEKMDFFLSQIVDEITSLDDKLSHEFLIQIALYADNLGSSWGHLVLGFYYETGAYSSLLLRDINKAFFYYQKAADLNNDRARSCLGLLFLRGEAVDRDATEAFSLWEQAANNSDPMAQALLGSLYERGYPEIALPKNEERAIELYKQSIGQNYHLGFAYYGRYFERQGDKHYCQNNITEAMKNFALVFEYYKVASNLQSPFGKALLGRWLTRLQQSSLISGDLTVTILQLYQDAARFHEPLGLTMLARAYQGEFFETIKKSPVNSDILFKQAIEMNEPIALCLYAKRLVLNGADYGDLGVKQLAYKALMQDEEMGYCLYGLMIEDEQRDSAISYYKTAADYGDTNALFLYARSLLRKNKLPTLVNFLEVYPLLLKAFERGCQQAEPILKLVVSGLQQQGIIIPPQVNKNIWDDILNSASFSESKLLKGKMDDEQIIHFEVGYIVGKGAQGECAFTAFGIDRKNALTLLKENGDKIEIRCLVAPEIRAGFLENSLPKSIMQTQESLALKVMLESHEEIFDDLLEYCCTQKVYDNFIADYVGTTGWLSYVRDFNGSETSTMDALAQIKKIQFYIWQEDKNGETVTLVHKNKLLLEEDKNALVKPQQIIHLLHNKACNHFNFMFESTNLEKEKQRAPVVNGVSSFQAAPNKSEEEIKEPSNQYNFS